VVVGYDVSIRRQNDSTPNPVLKLGLRLHLLLAAGAEEELPKAGRQILRIDAAKVKAMAAVLGVLVVLREVTATLTTAGVTREATASTALSSATSDDTLLSSSGPAAAAAAWALP
jgi:hypothetical protein